MSDDAFHVTAPPEDGAGAALAMQNAIRDAAISPDKIHYINAHGTSTPAGDVAESNAAKRVLGPAASRVRMSSTKSMIGHLLGRRVRSRRPSACWHCAIRLHRPPSIWITPPKDVT